MDDAEKFFTRLTRDGLKPNDITYGTLIKGYAKTNNLEKMMKKYEEMKVNGVKPTQKTLTMIMDAYGKNKDFGSAVVWYKEMESSGLPPDQKAKNVLLSLAKTADEMKEAKQIVGLLDHDTDKEIVNGVSRFVDDDEDEDNEEDDDYNGDELDGGFDAPSRSDFHSGKQDGMDHFVGEYQENLEALHMLKIC